jgi:hypothetical protein
MPKNPVALGDFIEARLPSSKLAAIRIVSAPYREIGRRLRIDVVRRRRETTGRLNGCGRPRPTDDR